MKRAQRQLNLATKPFGASRLFWLLSGVGAAILLITAVALIFVFASNRTVPPELITSEQALSAELRELSAEEAQLLSRLSDPETIDIYDRSYFLNQLLTRKGISWTATFSDIEEVLPPRVLMMQIRPEVTFDNKVELDMRVGAETPQDVIAFLAALETSEVFGPPDVRGYAPPNDSEPYHRYDITVRYEQQL